jgi:hypothetical protein
MVLQSCNPPRSSAFRLAALPSMPMPRAFAACGTTSHMASLTALLTPPFHGHNCCHAPDSVPLHLQHVSTKGRAHHADTARGSSYHTYHCLLYRPLIALESRGLGGATGYLYSSANVGETLCPRTSTSHAVVSSSQASLDTISYSAGPLGPNTRPNVLDLLLGLPPREGIAATSAVRGAYRRRNVQFLRPTSAVERISTLGAACTL